MNKRQRKKKKDIKRATRIVFKELREMSKEKFEKLLKSNEPTCTPETCQGECQGMGWCEIATKFREEEIPKILAAGPIQEIECDPTIGGR